MDFRICTVNFHYYLNGVHFILVTDVTVFQDFHRNKDLPQMTSSRFIISLDGVFLKLMLHKLVSVNLQMEKLQKSMF